MSQAMPQDEGKATKANWSASVEEVANMREDQRSAAVGIGQRLTAQRVSRGGGQLMECVVVNVDQDAIWCVALGLCIRPLPGEQVRVTVDDGHVTQTGITMIQQVKRTRRGFAFALLHPDVWDITVYDTAIRIPVDFPAEVLAQEQLKSGNKHPVRATLCALSLSGGRIRSRVLLHENSTLLLRFSLGSEYGQCTVLAKGVRAITGVGSGVRGYELDVRFIKMDETAQKAIRETVQKQADEVERERQRQVELSAGEWVDIQAEVLDMDGEARPVTAPKIEGLEDIDASMIDELWKAG
jgi:hypothetical protein